MNDCCPCQSGKPYAECCEPLHLVEKIAETAEQLMRSRYTAYTLQNIDYIVATTVPSQQTLLDRSAMQAWAAQTKWLGLAIEQHLPKISPIHSYVVFNAFFQGEQGQQQTHHERSLFVKINGRWYFVDPTVSLPTLKQPCLCGSGKKFKHCCAKWL